MAQIKKFNKYDPPKSEVSKAKISFGHGGNKKFLVAPKIKK